LLTQSQPQVLEDSREIFVLVFRQLYEMTNRIANVLKSHGVGKGDPVVLYLPVSPVVVAAMLACSRIGAIHSVVFAGFSAEALGARINDGE
jgi:acetyl-CoA synthetase